MRHMWQLSKQRNADMTQYKWSSCYPFPVYVNKRRLNCDRSRSITKWIGNYNIYLLEEVAVVDVSEKGHCVGQHPDIAAPAVVVRLRPPAILVFHCQDLVLLPFRVHAVVERISVESWEQSDGETIK